MLLPHKNIHGFIDSLSKKLSKELVKSLQLFAEQGRVSLYRLVKLDTYRNYQNSPVSHSSVEANDKQTLQ